MSYSGALFSFPNQVLQDRLLRLEQEAMASERQAASMSERQKFDGEPTTPKLVKVVPMPKPARCAISDRASPHGSSACLFAFFVCVDSPRTS